MNLRDALQAVYDKHGQLTPALVVEEARDPASPLHSRVFDVDATQAAELYYLNKAHDLIRQVKVVYRSEDGSKRLEIRQWYSVQSSRGFVFEPAEKVSDDPLLRELVLRDMQRQWKDLYARFSTFSEFLDMVRRDLDQAS